MIELTTQEQQEAERMLRIRRHIYDFRNIKDTFSYSFQGEFGDWCIEDVELSDLSDQDKFALVVIMKDFLDYGTIRSDYKPFGWDKKYVSRLAKNEAYINVCSLFNVDNGTIAGRGYVLNGRIRHAMNEMYEEFLWHDASEPFPEGYYTFIFRVDIPNIYTGQSQGYVYRKTGEIMLKQPHCPYDKIPDWPERKDGYGKAFEISLERKFIKQWRLTY